MTIEELARKWEMSDPPEDRHLPTRAEDEARWWARAFAEVLEAVGDEFDSEGSLRITMNGGDIYRTPARFLRGLADD